MDQVFPIALEKKGTRKLTFPSDPAYSACLTLNSGIVDLIIHKFVPRDCRGFYDAIQKIPWRVQAHRYTFTLILILIAVMY